MNKLNKRHTTHTAGLIRGITGDDPSDVLLYSVILIYRGTRKSLRTMEMKVVHVKLQVLSREVKKHQTTHHNTAEKNQHR